MLAGYLSSDMLWAPDVTGDLLASHGQGYFRMLEPINKALEITIIPLTGSVSFNYSCERSNMIAVAEGRIVVLDPHNHRQRADTDPVKGIIVISKALLIGSNIRK